VLVVEAQVVLV
jgi:hypothetical protein